VEQSKLLKLLKCEEAQGYLFSKPLPGAEIERMLRAQAADNGIRGRGKEVKSG
jgi:EAL domain-containing protein (putative c-di-GMP-specific phosphodiesterase class I)